MPRSRFAAHLVAALVLAATACVDPSAPTDARSPADVASPSLEVALAPAPAPASVLNLAYATRSTAEKLDLYLPTGKGPFPVVLWLHPGGWQTGDKKISSTSVQMKLLANGYALASANYRLSGQARYPAQIQDAKAAVRWLRANAALYKLDPKRIGVWGLSAGAHLAALLGTTSGVTALTDLSLGNAGQSDAVKAVVAMATPVNFLTLDALLKQDGCKLYNGTGHNAAGSPPSLLMGAPIQTIASKVATANPQQYVSVGDAKFLIQHGQADCTIPWQHGQTLHQRLQAVLGASASQLDLFPTGKHGGTHFTSDANFARILAFLRANL
ncbi:MAG: alpha/beta hydrolase [Gemmatimonadaceae bacterium]|nr:alpha/beta hydrolase [Gemmatimonadaceae bacterium]